MLVYKIHAPKAMRRYDTIIVQLTIGGQLRIRGVAIKSHSI